MGIHLNDHFIRSVIERFCRVLSVAPVAGISKHPTTTGFRIRSHFNRVSLFAGMLAVSGLLFGCGGDKRIEMPSCIPETSITSTDDVTFYFIEVANRDPYYSSLTNSDVTDNYLCVHIEGAGSIDQCGDDALYRYIDQSMEPDSVITFDGFAVKTIPWGARTLGASGPTTWFRGTFDGRTIWVYASQLNRMYEHSRKFSATNQSASKLLKLSERNAPVVRNPDGNAPGETLATRWGPPVRISDWNCDL